MNHAPSVVLVRHAEGSPPFRYSESVPLAVSHDPGEDAVGLATIIGGNVRQLRKQQGLSLETLARRSHVSRAMLSQIELGRSTPTIAVLWKIAYALEAPISAFLSEYLPVGQHSFATGAEALGCVRPHELEIATDPSEPAGIEARVERVLSFGSTSRVELTGADRDVRRYYEVELSRERIAGLQLAAGQVVRLKPVRVRLFASSQAVEASV